MALSRIKYRFVVQVFTIVFEGYPNYNIIDLARAKSEALDNI